jgi:hypothetical protein
VVGAGWDACPASWWIEIAATLTAAGLTWPRPACLQDLRFWDGQVRAGFRKAIPSRRQLARRWRWTDWKVRDLLRTEDWKERRMSAPPKNLPTSSQLPPGFEPIEQVQPFPASQPPPNRLPKTSTRAYLTGTQITDTQDRPAGVSLEEVGSGRDGLWPELRQDLRRAGYQTIQQLQQDGRSGVARALGKSASRSRLDAVGDLLQRRGLPWGQERPRTTTDDTDERIPTWATRRRIQRPEPTPEPSQAETTPAPWEL